MKQTLLCIVICLSIRMPAPGENEDKPGECWYKVVFFQPDLATVLKGTLTAAQFRKEFREDYPLTGERISIKGKAVVGATVAACNGDVFVIPIVEWKNASGETIVLCQASDDGTAPRFSVGPSNREALVKTIAERISRGPRR